MTRHSSQRLVHRRNRSWSGALAALSAAFRTWQARRLGLSPPDAVADRALRPGPTAAGPSPASASRTTTAGVPVPESFVGAGTPGESAESALWRMRTTVDDVPGTLALLCAALAGLGTDILTLQTHPLSDGTVDEFLLRTPARVTAEQLAEAVTAAGGRETWMERADTHDLVDTPTRMLHLATRTALDTAQLPLSLRQLLGRCSVRSLPADRAGTVTEDAFDGTTMCLRDPSGGSLHISRPYLPFTPSEFARARALVELDDRLGTRVPGTRDVMTLPAGNEITVRRAGPHDIDKALALHERCSPRTLERRYHGPVADASRYLNHLLSPRFGQTMAVEAADGSIVALAHLMWDGDETEVALLVEDTWQRRGIGMELLRRLVSLAEEAGCASVYAITQADNAGMVASMRRLALPLDYQVEDGTLVITARLPYAEDLSKAGAGRG